MELFEQQRTDLVFVETLGPGGIQNRQAADEDPHAVEDEHRLIVRQGIGFLDRLDTGPAVPDALNTRRFLDLRHVHGRQAALPPPVHGRRP